MEAGSGRDCACVGQGINKNSVPSIQFHYETKIGPKNSLFFFLMPKHLMGKETMQDSDDRMLPLLLSHFSHVRLLATPWTAAHQAPPSMGFFRQEYWSGVPLSSPDDRINKFKNHKIAKLKDFF